MDARVHQLQGKTERVTDLLPMLQEFYREKLASLLSHQAAAKLVEQYDINNTYQYIVNREETQLSWLAVAIADKCPGCASAGHHRDPRKPPSQVEGLRAGQLGLDPRRATDRSDAVLHR